MTTIRKTRKRSIPDYNNGDIVVKWTILKEDLSLPGIRAYLCRCTCGNERVATVSNLFHGKSTQCKSCQVRQVNTKNNPYPPRVSGEIVGKWTILKETKNKGGQQSYLCKCVCGIEKVVQAFALFKGVSTQCAACRISEKKANHQNSKSPVYGIWGGMRDRCNNPRNKDFHLYGGRGIKVCERWNNFKDFSADMGERPEGATLDRIDPDRGYEPGNCRWVTGKENLANRRNGARYRGLYIYVKKEKLCEDCLKK